MNNVNEQIQAKNQEIYQNKIAIDTNKNIENFNITVANLIDITAFKKKNILKENLKEYKEEIKKILTKRSVGLLEAISSSNINHKKLDELVDEISKKFTENIKNLSFEDKIFKDINKNVESEEKIKSQSLKNSYSETKKYIDNIVNLSLSVQQENPKVYSKKEQKNGVK